MRSSRVVLSLVLAWASASAAVAQAPAPPAEAGSLEQDVRELLIVMGTEHTAKLALGQMLDNFRKTLPQVPAEFWDAFQAKADASELIELMIPVYTRHFSRDEVRELTAFFRTPLGRKFTSESGPIQTEAFEVGQRWGTGLAAQVDAELKAKGVSVP
ncbi:MAG TPA: DUF2059 domain-containing protein [Candidatus Polarisedimenticolaceae bacterium]|nr:DUF2059 domain-containing protein [Candidatus Polarisedimenticolaceae bacterium]